MRHFSKEFLLEHFWVGKFSYQIETVKFAQGLFLKDKFFRKMQSFAPCVSYAGVSYASYCVYLVNSDAR